jgi:hypothetical protein
LTSFDTFDFCLAIGGTGAFTKKMKQQGITSAMGSSAFGKGAGLVSVRPSPPTIAWHVGCAVFLAVDAAGAPPRFEPGSFSGGRWAGVLLFPLDQR